MKKFISLILIVLMGLSMLTSCGETGETESPNNQEKTSEVVYEDDILTVTFVGVSDVAGQIGLSFTLENKGAEEITVLPLDSSINGTMVQFTSGTIADIQAGKKLNQVWMCNPEVIGISNSSEVKTIEFSLDFADTDTDTIKIEL